MLLLLTAGADWFARRIFWTSSSLMSIVSDKEAKEDGLSLYLVTMMDYSSSVLMGKRSQTEYIWSYIKTENNNMPQ